MIIWIAIVLSSKTSDSRHSTYLATKFLFDMMLIVAILLYLTTAKTPYRRIASYFVIVVVCSLIPLHEVLPVVSVLSVQVGGWAAQFLDWPKSQVAGDLTNLQRMLNHPQIVCNSITFIIEVHISSV